jgi:Ca2+-binding RTX toxin-like protein
MTTYNWTALANGTVVAFNPAVDVLNFDDASVSAGQLYLFVGTSSTTLSTITKSVTLQTGVKTLRTISITFVNGSLLVVGDNTTATGNDDAANTLTGGDGRDFLIGLGGADTITGGAGKDTIYQTAYSGSPFSLGAMTASMAALATIHWYLRRALRTTERRRSTLTSRHTSSRAPAEIWL